MKSRKTTALLGLLLITACQTSQAGPGSGPAATDNSDTSPAVADPVDLLRGQFQWTCKNPDGNVAVEFTHQGRKIIREAVDGYLVIDNGAPADQPADSQVFNVKTSDLTISMRQIMHFTLSLQDYSEYHSWIVYLQADPAELGPRYLGASLSTYQSSDGDDQLHPDTEALTCTVRRTGAP
jgi:hypothetical protein